MKTTLRESQLLKALESLFAENNSDLISAKFYCSHENGNQVFGCDIHHDGDFDVDAALRVKPVSDPYAPVREFLYRYEAHLNWMIAGCPPNSVLRQINLEAINQLINMRIFMKGEASARASS